MPELLHVRNLWLLPVQVVVAAVFYVGVAVALRLSPVREIAKALQPQAEKKFGADSRLSRLLDWFMKNAGRAHA